MRKACFVAIVFFVITGAPVFGAGEAETYPARDITNILVWGAGGGTDTANRLVMAEMSDILGVPINVQNVTGGVAGSEGMTRAYEEAHDGYTLAGISESIVTAGVLGGWDRGMDVWDFFIIGGSPTAISVSPNSDYDTLDDLIEVVVANPGSIRAGASAAGSIHHLNLLAFEQAIDSDFHFVPYDSSAGSQTAAMTGEIEVVITTVAEQAQLIRGGELRPLAVLVPQEFRFADSVIPSAWDYADGLDEYLPIEQAIGFAVAMDVPEDRKQTLRDAFDQAMQSSEILEWLDNNYWFPSGVSGDEANRIFADLERSFSWTLWELGAATVHPDELGIERP